MKVSSLFSTRSARPKIVQAAVGFTALSSAQACSATPPLLRQPQAAVVDHQPSVPTGTV